MAFTEESWSHMREWSLMWIFSHLHPQHWSLQCEIKHMKHISMVPPLGLTFSLHVVDRVGNDFVGVVERLLPCQQDSRAWDGLSVDVSRCAGPVLGHDNDKASQGQHRTLFAFCQALVDCVVLGNDLGYYQFTVKQYTKYESIWTIEKQLQDQQLDIINFFFFVFLH